MCCTPGDCTSGREGHSCQSSISRPDRPQWSNTRAHSGMYLCVCVLVLRVFLWSCESVQKPIIFKRCWGSLMVSCCGFFFYARCGEVFLCMCVFFTFLAASFCRSFTDKHSYQRTRNTESRIYNAHSYAHRQSYQCCALMFFLCVFCVGFSSQSTCTYGNKKHLTHAQQRKPHSTI